MTNITTKLRTGDEVVVLAGRDIGKTGTLRKIIKSKNKGIVTGVNMVKKHTKPNPEMGVTGGIVEQESSIDLSNLAIWNSKTKSKDKIAYSVDKEGKKIRLFKSDNKEIK
jgi:large subunit ribosomal protein L24